MKRLSLLAPGLVLALFPLLSGCHETSETVTTTPETVRADETDSAAGGGHVVACQMCYEQVKVVRQDHGKGAQWSRNQIIREHQCPDCKSMATFYTRDGVPMFKCAKCAPEGVACDKCVPPRGT